MESKWFLFNAFLLCNLITVIQEPNAIPLEENLISKELIVAIRHSDDKKIDELLKKEPNQVNQRDEFGNTPLILAALYANEDCVKAILDHGADANALNNQGVTALMNVSGSVEKAKVLIDYGAKVNAQSEIGNTALIRSAIYVGSTPLVELLLKNQADVNLCNSYGVSPLIAASITGNQKTIELLLKHGAQIKANLSLTPTDMKGNPLDPFFSGGQSALMWSALVGNQKAVKQLLELGADVNESQLLGNPLIRSTWRGEKEIAQMLIDHGANVDQRDQFMANFTPLLWACTSDTTDASLIEVLTENGADVNAKGGSANASFMEVPQTPLMWTMRQKNEHAIKILKQNGALEHDDPWAKRQPKPKEADQYNNEISSKSVVKAINQVIPKIENAMLISQHDFKRKGQDCASCHSQYLPQIALSALNQKGIEHDQNTDDEIKKVYQKPFNQLGREIAEPTFHPAPSIEFGYVLMSGYESGIEADYYIDLYVNFVAATQSEDGRWVNYLPRPPMQSSDVGATAWGLQALALYPLPGRMDEMTERIERAKQWLWQVEPRFTDERVFQLLGLHWAGVPQQDLKLMAESLIAEQRIDGGWSQLSGLESDAYATGSVLYALHKAAGISPENVVYQKGVRYLLKTQLEDGTWFVRRRAFPFQPTMDTGFPHGRDGWISTAATSWALLALEPLINQDDLDNGDELENMIVANLPKVDLPERLEKQVEYSKDIQPIFDRSCIACHSSEQPRSGYRLDQYDHLMQLGKQGFANIIPGDSANSPLLHYITGSKEDLEMPPQIVRASIPELSNEEIGLIRTWIDQGARN